MCLTLFYSLLQFPIFASKTAPLGISNKLLSKTDCCEISFILLELVVLPVIFTTPEEVYLESIRLLERKIEDKQVRLRKVGVCR